MKDFFSLYSHGFARMAVATPVVRVGDPQYNVDASVELMREAARGKAVLAVFPELGLSAYTCEDLFHQHALLDGCRGSAWRLLQDHQVAAPGSPWWACRWRSRTSSTTARRWFAGGGSSAWCPRPTCRTTASSTRGASSRPPTYGPREAIGWLGRAAPSATTCCSGSVRAGGAAFAPSTWRSARTSGCRCRPPRSPRSPAPPCSSTSRPRTSRGRQGRLSPRAGGQPVGALPGGVPLQRRGAGRIHHRPGVGRPRAHLRERRR